MAVISICSDFGAQKNKVSHCFPIYLPWSDENKIGWTNIMFKFLEKKNILHSIEYYVYILLCWGLNYVPPKFTCWILTSNVTIFGDKAFIEVIKFKKIASRVGPYSARTVVLKRRSRDESNLFLGAHRGKARWGSRETVPPCQLRKEAYQKPTRSCWLSKLRFPTSRTVRKYVSVV